MEREKLALCGKLFWKFFKIGAFTFGGGYAMIPLIRREIAQREGWLEDREILDVLAVSESTPGPMAVNTATFVGYRVAGNLGAALATKEGVVPTYVIIYLLNFLQRKIQSLNPRPGAAFAGQEAVVSLVASAFLSMLRQCPRNWPSYLLAAGAFLLVAFAGANAIVVLIGCALLGLAATKFSVGGVGK